MSTLSKKSSWCLLSTFVSIVILVCVYWYPEDDSRSRAHVYGAAGGNPDTLTKRGDQLNFNYSPCPSNSLMSSEHWKEVRPLHDDCPAVFVIGARKGGTTSLYHYLDKHPNFRGIEMKDEAEDGETYYFSLHYNSTPWAEYIKRFPRGEGTMSGESTVDNLLHCKVPERLFRSCGNQVKAIMLLRNPIQRLESNFLMRANFGIYPWHPTSMETVLSDEIDSEIQKLYEAVKDVNPSNWVQALCAFRPTDNLVYEGLYYVFVMNWLCNFPAENILIINSEEFFQSTASVLSQVFQFVGLSAVETSNITSRVHNTGADFKRLPHQQLKLRDVEKLMQIYRPMNNALFDILQWFNVDWNLWKT